MHLTQAQEIHPQISGRLADDGVSSVEIDIVGIEGYR